MSEVVVFPTPEGKGIEDELKLWRRQRAAAKRREATILKNGPKPEKSKAWTKEGRTCESDTCMEDPCPRGAYARGPFERSIEGRDVWLCRNAYNRSWRKRRVYWGQRYDNRVRARDRQPEV